MAGITLHTVLDHLRRLHTRADAAQRSDRELLHAFATDRDQEAFAVVVRRHAALVWGVCRRILGHQQDAEDAFQATFVILARRAGSVRWRSSVGGWLHTVAQRLAVRVRRQAEQRRFHERQASRTPVDSSLRELAAVVDEELQRLPVKYREPLLLHYWEGMTAETAARQLGLSRALFYRRLNRGREMLRERLCRQGLSLAAPLLAAALAPEVEAASGALLQATLRGVMGNVPERVAILAAEALGFTAVVKLKTGVALAVLLGLAAGGVAMLMPQTKVPSQQAERPADPPKVEDKSARRVDRYGDPLPPGAIARLGTLRFRVDAFKLDHLAFAPDGRTLAVTSQHGLDLFDVATGKQTKSIPPPDHSISLTGGIFSSDGKRLLMGAEFRIPGSQKWALQIWDAASGRKIAEVERVNMLMWGCTAEGQPWTASLGKGEIILHELANGRKRHFPAKDLPDPTTGFPCFFVVGKNLLVASDNNKGVVYAWDIANGEERWSLKTEGILSGGLLSNGLALSPDDRWLASLSLDGAGKEIVQLWDTKTGKAVHTVTAEKKYQYLQRVAFTPDSKMLATIGWLGIRFWDVASGRERGQTKGDGRTFGQAIAFSPDGKTLATVERHGGTIHLWDVATGERRPEPEGHSSFWPDTPAFSPDGERVATSGGPDGMIRVWDAATGQMLTTILRSPRPAAACAFLADGRTLFSCWDDKLLFSDATTGQELHALKPNDPDRPNIRQQGECMYLSDDRRKAIVFSRGATPTNFQDWLLTGWDTTTRKQWVSRPLAFHGSPHFTVSADATLLALPATTPGRNPSGIATGQGPMHLEDVTTGERLLTFPTLQVQTWPLAFSPDRRLLISITFGPATPLAPDGQTLRVWEVLTARELLALPTSNSGNVKAVFSPDGRVLALSAPWTEILLWDVRSGKELRRFKNFNAQVTSLAFSPDGRRLVSGLSDSTLLVWDVGSLPAAPVENSEPRAAKAWADLPDKDAPRAFRARGALASAPEEAITMLTKHLHPARPADPQRLRRLLTELESDQFAVREKAQEELQQLGDLAEPALRRAMANKPTLEMRRRMQALLEGLRGPVTRPELLQALRAVAVLEDIGTPEARRLLEQLAKGTPEARLTREAKASLRRLDLRKPDKS